MKKSKGNRPFDWIPYLFGKEENEEDNAEEQNVITEESNDESTNNKKKKKVKKRKGIDDEDPVSFRTANEPLTVQQIIYYVLRDLAYACGPMFSYIGITILCIIIGYPFSGMTNEGFAVYIAERSNMMIALGVVLTLHRLYRKSRKKGSTFFEDASLYHKGIDIKKILMSFFFGMGVALFLSALLTFMPKVWIFATYDQSVAKIYQRYDILLTILESAFLTPLVEEIIFRGYMLNRLLRRWADMPALIVTTVIFSIMHGTSVWIIYAFIMGYIIGKLSMIEGNILYGIFLHAGFNMPSVVQWFIYFVHPELQSTSAVTNVFQTLLLGTAGLVLAIVLYMVYRRNIETMRG